MIRVKSNNVDNIDQTQINPEINAATIEMHRMHVDMHCMHTKVKY